MSDLLSAAGRAFLRAFIAAITIYSLGVLTAPNLDGIFLLGVTALGASLAAGIRAVQQYVPMLTFARYLPQPFAGLLDAFTQSFIGSAIVVLPGMLDGPNLALGRTAWTALMIGALTSGLRAIQGDAPEPETRVEFVRVEPEVAERKPVVRAAEHKPPVMTGRPPRAAPKAETKTKAPARKRKTKPKPTT